MRPQVVSLVLVLAALGCRPKPEPENPSPTSTVGDDLDDTAGIAGDGDTDLPPRPEGTIYRSELARGTQDGNPAYLLAQLGPEPYRPEGRFEGWMITRVWPADPELCAPGCDLRPGDVVLSVNGSQMKQPEDLSTALENLDAIEAIELRGLREGEYFERRFVIAPDPPLDQ